MELWFEWGPLTWAWLFLVSAIVWRCTITLELMNSRYVNQLADVIVALEDKKTTLAFLKNILTPAELEEVSTRLQIVKLLKKGMPQREVAEKLSVSIGTVSRGSRELKYGGDGFEKVLSWLFKTQKNGGGVTLFRWLRSKWIFIPQLLRYFLI